MANQQGWTSGLESVDALSAELILQLQLEDITALGSANRDVDQAAYQRGDQRYVATRNTVEDERAFNLTEEHATSAHGHDDLPLLSTACVVCGDRFNTLECQYVPCGHLYCGRDLDTLFRLAMNDRTLYPPQCCGRTIPFDDIRYLISGRLERALEAKKEELDDSTPTYCRVRTCSAYIGESGRAGKVATCPTCNTTTCIECQRAPHGGHCATDAAAQETLALAEREGWRRCPGCERLVELSAGCYHMTCLCRAQFCYLCGARCRFRERVHPLELKRLLTRYALGKTCECVQFEGDRLLERQPGEDRHRQAHQPAEGRHHQEQPGHAGGRHLQEYERAELRRLQERRHEEQRRHLQERGLAEARRLQERRREELRRVQEHERAENQRLQERRIAELRRVHEHERVENRRLQERGHPELRRVHEHERVEGRRLQERGLAEGRPRQRGPASLEEERQFFREFYEELFPAARPRRQ